MRSALGLDDAQDLPFEDLIVRVAQMLEQYDPPDGVETPYQRVSRVSRTLDEMPQVYRWLLRLQSRYDHWTDAWGKQFGQGSFEYKSMRQRRDFFARMASAAKMRYDGASRWITLEQGFDPTGMPRQRGGPG